MATDLPRWSNGFPLSKRARRGIGVATAVVAGGLVVSIVTSATPWPSALLIRSVFEAGAHSTVDEMLPYVPDTKLVEHPDVVYGDAGGNTSLDVFSPAGAEKPLPTVVWIHGGAWISGDRSNVAPYLKIIAAKGYTTVGLNYTIAPEATYPTAITQLNDALHYLTEHAEEFNIDPKQIVLAGDSAGAQLASQLAVLTTNDEYAELLGIQPALSKDQLAGTILNCGVYDLKAMADLSGITAWGFKIALWGYTGTKDWSETYAGATMSTVQFVTKDFPPTFISGGNGDGLTWIQSVPMAAALKDKGVDVTELFWAANHVPALPHEYQFHLDFTDAQTALDQTLAFLDAHTTR
jgi:acetyl esterase/lipase